MNAAVRLEEPATIRSTIPFAFGGDEPAPLAPARAVLHSKQYRILKLVGEGGMGKVYRAHDPILERDVALKVLKPGLPAGARQRFVREARYGARLCHRNIVRVYDLGVLPDEALDWFAMEYLMGRDLEDLLQRADARDGRLPPRVVFTVFDRILDALTYAHERGVVHRDVKPANIFVTRDREGQHFGVRLLDFGVALDLRDPGDTRDLCGDPRYCPPEQALGLQRIDHRADLYATGMALCEALTGRHPFRHALDGKPMEIVRALCELRFPMIQEWLPSQWPERTRDAIAHMIGRACAKDPSERFEDAPAMRRALRQAFEVRPTATDARLA